MARIVVGVDDSQGARRALAWALEQAASSHATVEAVHVFQRYLAWVDLDLSAEERQRSDESAIASARGTLDRVVDEVLEGSEIPVERVVLLGEVAAALVEQAAGADLLVVGSHGRGGLKALVLGSVSRRCTELASCPVVVIPTHVNER